MVEADSEVPNLEGIGKKELESELTEANYTQSNNAIYYSKSLIVTLDVRYNLQIFKNYEV